VRSWSLVNRAATANRMKLLFNLHKAKSKISVFDNGDIRHDQVETIAKRLGVTEQDVIDMNGWLSGDASLNAPIRADSDSAEWLDWLVDEGASQEATLAASDELDNRRKALASAFSVLTVASGASSKRVGSPRTRSRSRNSPTSSASRASACARSPWSSFEKVQKAVKNRVAPIETPAPLPV
jgi:RNA polymerase sigma-32 factor